MTNGNTFRWRAVALTWLVGVCLSVLCGAFACSRKPTKLNWPSFPPDVIEAGRGASVPAPAGSVSWSVSTETPDAQTEASAATIPVTKESILSLIEVSRMGATALERSAAFESLRDADVEAFEPLLAILKEDGLPCRYAASVMSLLARLGREDRIDGFVGQLPQVPAPKRPLSPHVNRIVDALVAYAAAHPDEQLPIAELARILPLKRLPELIDWAENSSGTRQRDFISIFSKFTHTNFPMIPSGFCGHSPPASINKAIRLGEEKQRESPKLMRAWWAEHGQQPYSAWVIGELMRRIEVERGWRTKSTKEYADDPKMQAHRIRQLPYQSEAGLEAYAFEPLCKKLTESPVCVRPYIVGLIAQSDHPKRLEYLAGLLHNADDHLKSAAIETLGRLNARTYAKQIRQVLEDTSDTGLQEKAIDVLSDFGDSTALEAIASRLASNDYHVAGAAESGIKKLLAENVSNAEHLAKTHRNAEVRRQLSELLKQRSAQQTKDHLQPVADLLRSNDPKSRRVGVRLVANRNLVELLPDCIDLLSDADLDTRRSVVDLIVGMGIPELSIANAQKLLGYSLKLDQRIALYCHARFGDAALPLVRQVAFERHDPARRGSVKQGGIKVGSPERKLFQILYDANDANLDERICKLIREALPTNRASEYVSLLGFVGSTASIDLIDEFLDDKEHSYTFTAIRSIRRNRLTQYADRLAEIAEAQTSTEPIAVKVLIEFEDARAWSAAVRFLEGNALNGNTRSLGIPGPSAAYRFGVKLAVLRDSHRSEMHEMLRAELVGPMRRWVVVALTAGLAHNPEAIDEELLLTIARNETAPRAAQISAAVALSHLHDVRCLPELQRLLRDCLRFDCQPTYEACRPSEFIFPWGDFERVRSEVYPRKQTKLELENAKLSLYSPHESSKEYSSIPDALRRLGDDSMVPELVEALFTPEGDWNWIAHTLLLELKGMEGYRLAREHAEQAYPKIADRLTKSAILMFGVEMSHNDVVEFLTFDELALRDEAVLIIKHDVREAIDPLIELFHKSADKRKRYRATILDILCRFGDPRGLDLALDDPLLFMEVADYLADPPIPPMKVRGFKFNGIQDALKLIEWYRRHRESLAWDDTIGKFRLASDEAARSL